MNLDWDAAPGPVEKYLITYKPDSGEAKEVSSRWFLRRPPFPGAVIKPGLKKAPLFCFFFWRTSRACALFEPSELMSDEFRCIFFD